MSTVKDLYFALDTTKCEKMMTETHKDVLLNPTVAISNLANRISDEVSCEDELLAKFEDGTNTGGIYDAALKDPAFFTKTMNDSDSTSAYMDEDSGVRSWVTLGFMFECRQDINAHNGASKEFYKSWLLSELLNLENAEANAAAASAPAQA